MRVMQGGKECGSEWGGKDDERGKAGAAGESSFFYKLWYDPQLARFESPPLEPCPDSLDELLPMFQSLK